MLDRVLFDSFSPIYSSKTMNENGPEDVSDTGARLIRQKAYFAELGEDLLSKLSFFGVLDAPLKKK